MLIEAIIVVKYKQAWVEAHKKRRDLYEKVGI